MSRHAVPLFPLRIVLFPGTPQLLHVFEPRYRQLLADCLEADRHFGLALLKPERNVPEPGDVGCMAVIKANTRLPDGRSDILIEGEQRFAIESVDPTDRPYFVASVRHYDDEPAADEARVRLVFDLVALLPG